MTSGWLAMIAWAMCCIRTVLPDFGGATIRARWPLPIGAIMSMMRPVRFSSPAHVTLEHEMLVREERRQVLEQHAVLDALGRQAVDGVDAHECEVAFAVLGRADLAFDRVAGVKIEAADLGGRDVDVVRARKIGGVRAAKEAEAVGKHFERAVTEDLLAALGLFLENGEHELLLAHALGVVDFERVGDVEQLRDVKGLEVGKMHSGF